MNYRDVRPLGASALSMPAHRGVSCAHASGAGNTAAVRAALYDGSHAHVLRDHAQALGPALFRASWRVRSADVASPTKSGWTNEQP